jgi:hypothetical protein
MPNPLNRAVDAAGDAIRKLIDPPPLPKHMAELAASRPRTMMDTTDSGWVNPIPDAKITHRQAVSRWYDNMPGGYDEAVRTSQAAMNDGSVWGMYGKWNPEDVDVPAEVFHVEPKMMPGSHGEHGPLPMHAGIPDRHAEIRVRSDALASPQGGGVVDHEVTHHLMAMPWKKAEAGRFDAFANDMTPDQIAASFGSAHLGVDDVRPALKAVYGDAFTNAPKDVQNGTISNAMYRMSQGEVDPRAAEVRRLYSWNTGKNVESESDARDALTWFMHNFNEISNGPQPPTMDALSLMLYRNGGEEFRNKLLRRLTQVMSVGGAASTPAAIQGLDGQEVR